MRGAWAGLLLALGAIACTGSAAVPPAATPLSTPSPAPTPIARATEPEPSPTPSPTPIVRATGPEPSPTPTPTHVPAATPTATPTPGLGLGRMRLEQAFPGISFPGMVYMTYPGDGSDRLFLVLQPGRIMVFPNDQRAASPREFLDIRERVSDAGREEGLLGMAFAPDFADNGHFYVYYSAADPRRSVLSRFSASVTDPNVADPGSERIVLEVPQPFSIHNGGQIVFGPDGYLYVGLGDGGGGGDPAGNGQDPSTLLGTILRIDIFTQDSQGRYSIPDDNPFVGRPGAREDARPEVWAYGLRNPWRFTFDRETGDLWAADVGQNRYEEVDIVRPGLNYGWKVMEGFHCFSPPRDCDQAGLEPPVAEYGREGGCSVTGGYVYRGSRLPSLVGAYVYGDFCSGKIWALRRDGSEVTEQVEIVDSDARISSFAEDPSGELYILSFDEKIYRLAAE